MDYLIIRFFSSLFFLLHSKKLHLKKPNKTKHLFAYKLCQKYTEIFCTKGYYSYN